MISRIGITLAICCCLTTAVAAQVVRFETTMGNIDMQLNPTKNTKLQGYVDNFLKYVNDNNYLGSWINRAPSDFVLQMGGFFSDTKRPPLTVNNTRPVATFDPVAGVPASTIGLSNTVGTVALALSNFTNNQTNPDSGTSSFFINVGDNTQLDPNFTVFATIPDMTVVNQIMALNKVNLTKKSKFGASSSNVGFTDVPVQGDGKQVFIKRAFVVTDASTSAATSTSTSAVQSLSALSASSSSGATAGSSAADLIAGTGSTTTPSGQSLFSSAVPEPSSFLMFLLGTMGFGFCRRRRNY